MSPTFWYGASGAECVLGRHWRRTNNIAGELLHSRAAVRVLSRDVLLAVVHSRAVHLDGAGEIVLLGGGLHLGSQTWLNHQNKEEVIISDWGILGDY